MGSGRVGTHGGGGAIWLILASYIVWLVGSYGEGVVTLARYDLGMIRGSCKVAQPPTSYINCLEDLCSGGLEARPHFFVVPCSSSKHHTS